MTQRSCKCICTIKYPMSFNIGRCIAHL